MDSKMALSCRETQLSPASRDGKKWTKQQNALRMSFLTNAASGK